MRSLCEEVTERSLFEGVLRKSLCKGVSVRSLCEESLRENMMRVQIAPHFRDYFFENINLLLKRRV